MKFLHTADWHLGVKTNGRDRLLEQKKVLDEILSIASFEEVDCVIIAGDVFNTASPSADAEELFFDAIEKLSNKGDRFVFVLAGNHDDPTRLAAGLPLASKHNIALVSDLKKLNEKSFNQNSIISVVESGKGYIKLKKNEEIATIAYLPYPSDVRINEKLEEDNLSYAEKVSRWASIGASEFSNDTFNIFVSHLFMVGAKTRDYEVKAGDLFAVPSNMIPNADYTALGHIHTPQKLENNAYYSGSITELSIKQKNLGVNVFESENGKLVNFKQIKLQNTSRYEKVTANSIEDAEDKLNDFDDNDIIELEIYQTAPLSASSLKQLRKSHPCISNIALIRTEINTENSEKSQRKLLSDSELFTEFYKSLKGFEPSKELIEMFINCKGGENETD